MADNDLFDYDNESEISDEESDFLTTDDSSNSPVDRRDSTEKFPTSSLSDFTTSSTDYQFYYEVLSADEIVNDMVECIKEVQDVIGLPVTTVRLLLHHFRWDKEKLMERFFDLDHQDDLFRQAHVINPFKKSIASLRQLSIGPLTEEICAICCASKRSNALTGLECGHKFCVDCWRQYLKIKILDEGIGQTIPCPSKCDILVDDQLILQLIDEPSIRQKYQHLISNSFVECNRNLRWCPGRNCDNAIKARYSDAAQVQCKSCQTSFCFQCVQPWHEPIKCKWLKKWQKKCQDDGDTSNWIAANTKECPKCHITIEKNGGCNHLICKSLSCKYEFCWICLGPWEPHGSSWYNCNCFNEDDARRARDDQQCSRAALQRYLHYQNRYANHQMSLRLEKKLRDEVRKLMENLLQQMSWIEVQFLEHAYDVLKQCRTTLMYTYPFAFYLKQNNHSIIFEQNQADLEHATEELSGYLERDMKDIQNLVEFKQKIQDKSRYCSRRRLYLLKHVDEGYNCNYWEYNESV